jgi:hypothetical protein
MTQVKTWLYREAGVKVGNLRLDVYEGDDPDNPGSLLYTNTIAYSTIGAAPAIQEKTWSMSAVSSSGKFITMFTPDPQRLSDNTCPSVFNVDIGIASSGYVQPSVNVVTPEFTAYEDCSAPDGFFSSSGRAAHYIEVIVDGETYESALNPDRDPPGQSGLSYRLCLVNTPTLITSRFAMVFFADPPEKAITPYFVDGENSVPGGTSVGELTWEDGGGADTYDVYFGEDFGFPGTATKVASEITDTSWLIPENIQAILGKMPQYYLNPAQGYTWRVDSTNRFGTTTGDEWDFTTTLTRGLGGARNPTPITEATGQSVTITGFSWLGCEGSATNTVYMGESSGQLTKQYTISGSQLNVNPSSYGFNYGGTTYWRVDTSNGLATVTGAEWSLTFLTLGNGDGTGIIVTPAGPWGAGGSPTKRLVMTLSSKGLYYEDLL